MRDRTHYRRRSQSCENSAHGGSRLPRVISDITLGGRRRPGSGLGPKGSLLLAYQLADGQCYWQAPLIGQSTDPGRDTDVGGEVTHQPVKTLFQVLSAKSPRRSACSIALPR
jgi:hypothetical protein